MTADDGSVTLGPYAARWLRDARAHVRPATHEHYDTCLRLYVPPAFLAAPLASLGEREWRDAFQALLARPLAPNTVLLLVTCLARIYAEAEAEGLVTRSPITKAGNVVRRAKRIYRTTHEPCPIRSGELQAFMRAGRALDPTPGYPVYFLILARTGCRPGEGAALKVGDIDVDQRRLRIERSYTRDVVGPTKSGRGRFVDMSADLAAVLAAYIAERSAHEWLFPGHGTDRPKNTSNYRLWVKRAFAAAGLSTKHHLHCLRHGFATTLLEEGLADLFYVSRQLGHANISMTCDLYAKSAAPRNLQAVDGLDRAAPAQAPVPLPDGAMVFYHRTTRRAANAIIAHGFVDTVLPDDDALAGVLLLERPEGDDSRHTLLRVALTVDAATLSEYALEPPADSDRPGLGRGVPRLGRPRRGGRAWLLPSSLVNGGTVDTMPRRRKPAPPRRAG